MLAISALHVKIIFRLISFCINSSRPSIYLGCKQNIVTDPGTYMIRILCMNGSWNGILYRENLKIKILREDFSIEAFMPITLYWAIFYSEVKNN